MSIIHIYLVCTTICPQPIIYHIQFLIGLQSLNQYWSTPPTPVSNIPVPEIPEYSTQEMLTSSKNHYKHPGNSMDNQG